jgi:predicted O-methyltransferase YrrM
MHEFLQQMINERKTIDLDGCERRVTGGIALNEAQFVMSLIENRKLRVCMETGVSYGVSTLAICEALSRLDGNCKHFGIDPDQYREFNGAALAALKKCGYEHLFELMEGPSHLMLPKLIDREVKLDFAFIDGWHTFDYTLIDVFYADKMLRPGGFLLIHDLQMPSKRKVWKFLKTHRRYRRIPGPAPIRPITRRFLSLGKGILLLRPKAVEMAIRDILGQVPMLAAEKIENWEPNYYFFKNF